MFTDEVVHVDSDAWWCVRLADRLGAGFPRLERLRRYRDAEAVLPDEALTAEERETYLRFLRMNRMHIVELLRDARTAKQRVVGFRTSAPDDEDGDAQAWRLWRQSGLKRLSRRLFDDVADFGEAFLVADVLPGAEGGVRARFREENGWTVAAEFDPIRERVVAALQVSFDALNGVDVLRLWRQDSQGRVYSRLAVRDVGDASQVPSDGSVWRPGTDWQWRSQIVFYPGLSLVPVVPARTPSGYGVWEKHTDSVDRVNYITLQGVQLIVTQAFRQAAISSDQLPSVYPEDDPFGRAGQVVDYSALFKTGPSALWRLPGDADVKSFTPVDPRPIREWRDDEIRKLAAHTSTPFYMLSADSANNSAEGAALASDALLSQVEKMNDFLEPALEQAMSIAFMLEGDLERANLDGLETVWAPLKRASLGEVGSAASQAKAGGATQRWIDTHVFGMSPGERRQAEIDRAGDALFGLLEPGDVSSAGDVAVAGG